MCVCVSFCLVFFLFFLDPLETCEEDSKIRDEHRSSKIIIENRKVDKRSKSWDE